MLPEEPFMKEAYTRALQSVLEQAPPVSHASRSANLDAFLAAGFPGTQHEDWRYTDLSALAGQAFEPAAAPDTPDLSAHYLPGTQRMVFINGRFSPQHSEFESPAISRRADHATEVDEFDKDAVSLLNAALALDGAVLRLGPGANLDKPLHVLSVSCPGASASMSHLTHAVNLEAGARATVVFEDITLGTGAQFLTQRAWLRAMDGARLDVVRLQDHGVDTQCLARWDASVERDAQLDWVNLDLGGRLVRNDLVVNLAAPGASVQLSGAYAPAGESHLDNHTRIDHYHPAGRSRERYRGLVSDRAHAVFNGKVVVHPNAAKTDSEQHVANLLLSPTAVVNAKPELQIDNDDVKCAHGATCGQLDADVLYYLRSRGLPAEEARQLLLYSFVDEVLGLVEFEPARDRLRERFLARLPGAPRPGDLR